MIQKLQSNKFSSDLIWNLISFGFAGGVFIIINILLLAFYGHDVVGVFNEVYAVYIILSQLAVFGIHLAVQVYVPRFLDKSSIVNKIMTSALILAGVSSIIVCLFAMKFDEVPGELMDSKGVKNSFKYVIWGLLFFSLNKILLSYLNGCRRMKSLAIYQFMRVVFMLLTITVFILFDVDTKYIPSLLAIAEVLLFISLLPYALRFFSLSFKGIRLWLFSMTRYGIKAMPGNVLLDINTRVDVLMLGYFMTDFWVGIYAFALSIAEGVMQVPVLFRNNINPIITRAKHTKSYDLLNRVIRQNVKVFYKVIGGIGLITMLIFPVALYVVGYRDHLEPYIIVYSILIGGMVLAAGYLPFQMIFNQLGKPLNQSLFLFIIFIINLTANYILIPELGIYGAALGTSISILGQAVVLKVMIKRLTH